LPAPEVEAEAAPGEKAESFTELWKFVRAGNRWVLDEIDKDAGILDLASMRSFSQ